MHHFLLSFVAVAAAGFFAFYTEAGRLLTGSWSFVKPVEVSRRNYYRVKAKVAYKGEPIDFNIVADCYTYYNSHQDDAPHVVGFAPDVFGKTMTDGHTLVLRTPLVCDGETTENQQVPSDLLPMFVVFDGTTDFNFGIAYVAEEAYESPHSVLKFGGATIEAATSEEYDAFAKSRDNSISARKYANASGTAFPKSCYAFSRFLIPETLREKVRSYWPPNRPKFWIPMANPNLEPTLKAAADASALSFQLKKILSADRQDGQGSPRQWRSDSVTDPLLSWNAYDFSSDSARGMRTRSGGGVIHGADKTRRFPVANYPALAIDTVRQWNWTHDIQAVLTRMDTGSWPPGWQIDIRDGSMRGFAYCATEFFPGKSDDTPTKEHYGWRDDPFPNESNDKKDEATFSRFVAHPSPIRIDETDAVPALPLPWARYILFEGDQYYYVTNQIHFTSGN